MSTRRTYFHDRATKDNRHDRIFIENSLLPFTAYAAIATDAIYHANSYFHGRVNGKDIPRDAPSENSFHRLNYL